MSNDGRGERRAVPERLRPVPRIGDIVELYRRRWQIVERDTGFYRMAAAGEQPATSATHGLSCGVFAFNAELGHWETRGPTAMWQLEQGPAGRRK